MRTNKNNKNKKNKTKKNILKGGELTFNTLKDGVVNNIKKINGFIKQLYKYELSDKCETAKIEDYLNNLGINSENDITDLKMYNFYKDINSSKQKRTIKVSNPYIHGGLILENPSIPVPDNCVICFSSLINTYGTLPITELIEYFSYNKFIKNMEIKELQSLIQNLSLYSDINNIKHKSKVLREDDTFMTTYNNCFLNTAWYFPDQDLPYTAVRTDEYSFEYSQTFDLYNDKTPSKKQFNKKKIDYIKYQSLSYVIEELRLKGTGEYNIFFFNLCRSIKYDEDDKQQHTPRIENNDLKEELQYEFYIYFLNLEVIKQLKKEIELPLNIEYGNIPYCASVSVIASNVYNKKNQYNKFYFTKNYCFNRNNIFLDMFFNKILINHKLLENEYKHELLYFLSLSIFKQARFIILLKKQFITDKTKFGEIMNIIFKTVNKTTINKYKFILREYYNSIPNTLEVLDYFVELYAYINLFINIIETDNTLLSDDIGNILELKNNMDLSPGIFNDESLKQLFIMGDYGNSIKIFYNKKKHIDNFLYCLDSFDIKNLLLINVPNLLNTLNLIDSNIDDTIINLNIIYDIRLPNCYYNYNNILKIDKYTNLKFLTLYNLNLSKITEINNKGLTEITINNSEISKQCVFNINMTNIMYIVLDNIIVTFRLFNSKINKMVLTNIIIKENIAIFVNGITFINFTEWSKIITINVSDNIVIKDCIIDLQAFPTKINNDNDKINTVYFDNVNFKLVENGKYLIDLPKNIETLVIKECSFSYKNKLKFKNIANLNIDTLVIDQCSEIIEIVFEKNIIVKQLIIVNCNKLKKISFPNVGRFLGNKKYNISNIEIINVPLLKIKRSIANYYNSKKNGNIPINNII